MAVSTPSGVAHPLLLALLADGRVHSGQWLAAELGVSRAAVWQGVARLRARGIEVQALARRGYRLPSPVELLDAGRIRAAIDPQRAPRLQSLELLFEVDSTNTRLLGAAPPAHGSADVCASELQIAGRGRRGRRWVAPFGGGLALSLSWVFSDAARASPSLSLGVGVAVARALSTAGARGIVLKWPNDLWFNDRKVGGVLIELRAEAGGPAHVVIGVGLNVTLSAAMRREIEATGTGAAAVADACTEVPSRNRIAGAIIDEILSMLVLFERDGFASVRRTWMGLDALGGRPAQVQFGGICIAGTARGVDEDGALLLECGGEVRKFLSGEVSLRLIEG